MNNQLNIRNLDCNNINSITASSIAKCFEEYNKRFADESIIEHGIGIWDCYFDPNNGKICIVLENGVTIASTKGQDIYYIVTDPETDEERTFYYYQDVDDFISFN